MEELTLSPNGVNEKIDKLSIPAMIDGSVGYHYVDLDKILYLESFNNTTAIYIEGEKTPIKVAKTLLYFENELIQKSFLRVHQSFIINAQKLATYNKGERKFVTLVNGKKIDVSRSQKGVLEDGKIEKCPIPVFDELIFVDLKTVLYLEAHGDRTEFHLVDKTIMSTKNIGFFEKKLFDKFFCRIHDKYMINLIKVTKYYRGSAKVTKDVGRNTGYAVLNTGKGLPVSTSKKEEFLKYFRK